MPDNKTYRVKANIGEDHVDIDMNMVQDFSLFEFLSLKIDSQNLYRMHTANYGCVAGRVLANHSIGVPNVKISIFIEADAETNADAVLSYLYPYSSVYDTNNEGIRYNLLPEEQLFTCHRNVGTFPSKRLVLDDNNVFEVFDKYYKFTTTTNSSGDYMIFGVPVGSQMLHMDVDLSDIGDLLSQRPRDFLYKGYNANQFENASMFKKDTNLSSLVQILTQDESVDVKPFWGEVSEMGEADSTGVRITRKDIDLNYKFEPTCVFMGSMITDEKSNGFTKRCIPTERMGKMDRLTTGEGTIEMIRKTPDGSVEEFFIMGNQLIDGNGVWCYQIPMNLDYVMTDEYGNIVPTNDPEKGLPTRARVRFRFSLNDFASDYENNHLSKLLVPNNPKTLQDMGETYVFGTKTPDDDFRDLFWNKVYSVKSYIPRLQKSNSDKEKRFSGIKAVNVNVGNNPIPYNNMRIDITFMFTLQCAIMHSLIWIAGVFNRLIYALTNALKDVSCGNVGTQVFEAAKKFGCVTIGDGMCPDLEGWYFAPNCNNTTIERKNSNWKLNFLSQTAKIIAGKEGNVGENLDITDTTSIEAQEKSSDDPVCVTNNVKYFLSCIEMSLAQEYEVIQFDFYNDWINGLLYIPRWFANIKKKRKYLFGLIGSDKVITQACMEGSRVYQRRYVQQCAVEYGKENGKYSKIVSANGCVSRIGSGKYPQKCHKGKGRKNVKVFKRTNPGGGLVHSQQTLRSQYVYYFRPCDWINNGKTMAKINYFATDIILLGSLSVHDMDGIPQSFKELSSSSYQMPTNIAATNMDTAAYMYGKSGGAFCSGQGIQDGVQRDESTFDAYSKWASTTDFSDDTANDPNEYEVTEAAGIDWGYTGPDQEMYLYSGKYTRKRGGTTPRGVAANFDNAFYQPGGHFLGIACFNAESNVKSCVNLSRICEIGAEMSQRRSVVRRSGDKVESEKDFLVPTGLISKDDISDSGFRSEFATMNHNGLVTRINPLTNRIEYDFVSMLPRNFDGALKDKISSAPSPYNDVVGNQVLSTDNREYTRTIEEMSVDYYDFRLGIGSARLDGNGKSVDSRYLIVNNGTAALPMYNNSYYFYFGLHDGSTALDRFYKDFFAQCPESYDNKVAVRITTTGTTCENPYGGVARIILIGVKTGDDNKVAYTLKKDGVVDDMHTNIPVENSEFEIPGLEAGQYDITFTSNDLEDFTRSFSIVEVLPEWVSEFSISVRDFTKQKYNTDINDRDGRGGVTVSWDTDVVPDDVVVTIDGSTYEDVELDNGQEKLLPDGDATYKIRVTQSGGCLDTIIYTFTPSMPHEFDILFGGSRTVTYNRLNVKSTLSSSSWWENVFTGSAFSPEDKFFVEKAISYDKSLFLKETDGIEVEPKYGSTPYSVTIDGSGEMVVDEDTISISNGAGSGYDVNYSDFYIPTRNVPTEKVGYEITGQPKRDYLCYFADRNGEEGCARIPAAGSLTLPSIYKPFFFRCIIFKDRMSTSDIISYSLAIANGNTNEGMFSEVNVCGNDVLSNMSFGSSVNWWLANDGSIEDYQICKNNTKSLTPSQSGRYSVRIKENEPDNDNPVLSVKDVSESIRFIGEKLQNGADSTPDSRVRYFMLYRSTANGTRQRSTSENPDYIGEIRDKLVSKMTTNNGNRIVDGGQDSATGSIYWGGSCTKAFDITLNDGGHLIFNPANEIDRSSIFAGDVSVIPEENRRNDCFVLGVFDPWTELDDVDFSAAQNAANFNGKYDKVGKDTDMLVVMKLYCAEDFVHSVQNSDMYDDVTESNIKALRSFSVDVHTSDGLGGTPYEASGDVVLCSFDVNDDCLITIPELTLNAYTTDYLNGMRIVDTFFSLKNENGNQEYRLYWENFVEPELNTTVYTTDSFTTVLDELDTSGNRGRYVMKLHYNISLDDSQYGTSQNGYISFDGATITVIKK